MYYYKTGFYFTFYFVRMKKFATISVDDVYEGTDYPIIKNYIVSDGLRESNISLKYPTAIEGIVFALCLRGTIKLQINLTEYTIDENTLTTMLPGSICEVKDFSDDLLFEFLFFSIDFTYDLNTPQEIDILEKISLCPILKLTKYNFDTLLEFHSFMIKQYKRDNHTYRELLAKNLLSAFLTELCNIYKEAENNIIKIKSRNEELVQKFTKILIENIRIERTVQFYAEKMCLSPKYLSQLIKKITGKPIMEWINETTIVVIKAMLKTSTLSVLQISEELNFPNASFFGSYFKKHTGMTPIQYRES